MLIFAFFLYVLSENNHDDIKNWQMREIEDVRGLLSTVNIRYAKAIISFEKAKLNIKNMKKKIFSDKNIERLNKNYAKYHYIKEKLAKKHYEKEMHRYNEYLDFLKENFIFN
ncbi:hypothetical protein GVAV_002264 [Gurleya vavrai]